MEEEIKLSEIFQLLKSKTTFLIYSVSILVLLVSVWLFFTPNEYISKATVALNNDNTSSQNIGSGLQGLSSISSLVGINVNSNEIVSDYQIAYKKIKSRFFIEKFLNFKTVKKKLLGAEFWSLEDNKFKNNDEIYDSSKNKWKKNIPTDYELYKDFLKKFKVSKEGISGFVEISFKSESPHLSKYIVDEIVYFINKTTSEEALEQANSNLLFLEGEISKVKIAQTKLTISNLIEHQLRKKMLSLNSDEYIFRVIDPPLVPKEKSSPKRILIILSSVFIFLFLFSFFVIVNYLVRRKEI